MSKICVEITNEFLDEFLTGVPRLGWTVTGVANPARGQLSTFVDIDAPEAPADIDGWLCSPVFVRRDDGSVEVFAYEPVEYLL